MKVYVYKTNNDKVDRIIDVNKIQESKKTFLVFYAEGVVQVPKSQYKIVVYG